MKGKKITVLLAFSLGMSVFFTGCSFSSFTEKLINIVEPSAARESVQSTSVEGELFPNYIVNDSVEAPTFTQDLSGTVNVQAGGQATLTVQATVSSGEVSYQWYSNNVDANGGGTLIDGATEASYSPEIPAKAEAAPSSAADSAAASSSTAVVSSSQSGVDTNTGAEEVIASSASADTQEGTDNSQTTYYYAVAINTVNGEVNMTTSQTIAVTVWDNMYWAQNADNGGYQYVNRSDGSFPTDTVMNIDGVDYTFNADGYIVDASGNLLDYATGQPVGTTTDQAADQSAQQSTDQAADQSTQQSTDQTADQNTQQSTDQAADQSTEQSSGQ